jgi:excisionase family DNA binding protein
MELLNPKEASELLKVKLPTIYKWADDGTLPAIRIGKTVRFDKELIEEFLRKGGSNDRTT